MLYTMAGYRKLLNADGIYGCTLFNCDVCMCARSSQWNFTFTNGICYSTSREREREYTHIAEVHQGKEKLNV